MGTMWPFIAAALVPKWVSVRAKKETRPHKWNSILKKENLDDLFV